MKCRLPSELEEKITFYHLETEKEFHRDIRSIDVSVATILEYEKMKNIRNVEKPFEFSLNTIPEHQQSGKKMNEYMTPDFLMTTATKLGNEFLLTPGNVYRMMFDVGIRVPVDYNFENMYVDFLPDISFVNFGVVPQQKIVIGKDKNSVIFLDKDTQYYTLFINFYTHTGFRIEEGISIGKILPQTLNSMRMF